ncbi:hypothetical protein [Fictibacillus barbaricus]|uniref:Yip1 domain-containing protein n=1 Tax=Fictibacillus barbaricus TaxID=182136 RepID=A0ABS2ZEJ3_9BACL|nr:hypothetical protein [Fictibacillus barbaricus]MBN3546599.1 hypothetical protein [Fictibacillus barbaricus]GGB42306.1 hypothetical protein GCM10007199_04500 [Fictibacillus barbaricus]
MEEAFGKRKIFATIMTSLTFSLVFTLLSGLEKNSPDMGVEFIMIPIFSAFIAAAAIVFLGLITSAMIEYFICKIGVNYKISVPVYIILHGVSGLFIGRLIFRMWGLYAILGGGSALLFAMFDMWLLFRIKKGQGKFEETGIIYLYTIGTIIIISVFLYLFKILL